jgi:hypothetical protein
MTSEIDIIQKQATVYVYTFGVAPIKNRGIMSFITNDDHKLHRESKIPPMTQIDPKAFASTGHYLRVVAAQLANYARLTYRNGKAAYAETWIYVSGLADAEVKQILTEAAQEHVGKEPRVAVTVHTASMSQGETSVNLALVIKEGRS